MMFLPSRNHKVTRPVVMSNLDEYFDIKEHRILYSSALINSAAIFVCLFLFFNLLVYFGVLLLDLGIGKIVHDKTLDIYGPALVSGIAGFFTVMFLFNGTDYEWRRPTEIRHYGLKLIRTSSRLVYIERLRDTFIGTRQGTSGAWDSNYMPTFGVADRLVLNMHCKPHTIKLQYRGSDVKHLWLDSGAVEVDESLSIPIERYALKYIVNTLSAMHLSYALSDETNNAAVNGDPNALLLIERITGRYWSEPFRGWQQQTSNAEAPFTTTRVILSNCRANMSLQYRVEEALSISRKARLDYNETSKE